MKALLLAVFLLLPPVPAGPTVVTFKTADGMTIQADHYPGDEGMPGIVGLHMYPSDRSSWKPLAAQRPAGLHFLALDLRGYGGSKSQGGKDLSEAVKKRDSQLFQAMWQDALAGVKFLRDEAKCDPKRIGLVGASVGCSVAIDATIRRGSEIAAVAALTPGKDYLGVPTMDHVRTWKEQPLLLLSSEKEADGGARPIAAELKKRPEITLAIVAADGKDDDVHGTMMFGKVEGIEDRLASWFDAVLGRAILDGAADAVEKRILPGRGYELPMDPNLKRSLTVRTDSQGISILGEGAYTPSVVLFVDPAGKEGSFEEGGIRLRGTGSPSGTLVGACRDTWTAGQWSELPVGNRPTVLFVNPEFLEARIPWSLLRIEPAGTRIRVGITPIDRRFDWRAAPDTWKDALGQVVEVPK